jgi:pimeloyl-ACP methyl ester carboxylesterase
MGFLNFFNRKKNIIETVTIPTQTIEEMHSQEPVISNMEISISSKNGIEQYKSDVAKIDGGNDVLVIIVGINGSVYGYENKYYRIAKRANAIYDSTVFIFANDERNWCEPKVYFNEIIKHVKKNTVDLNNIKIKLFGYSAGALYASFFAWEYPEITNLLLVNPPLMDYLELTIDRMKAFSGNSTLVVGKYDPYYKLGELFTIEEYKDIFNNVVLFDGADHFFKGLLNEFINLPFQYLYERVSIII